MENLALKEKFALEDEDKVCPICGNKYEIIYNKVNDKKNISGYIQCPSCGMYTEF